MAIVYLSPTATDLSATASYLSTVDGATTGSLPSSGDTLVLYAGTTAITSGHAALAAIDLAEFIVKPECRKSSSTPIQLMVSHSGGPGKITYRGSADEFKIMADGDGVDDAVIRPNGGSVELSSDSTSTWAHAAFGPGNITLASSCRITNFTNSGAKLSIVDSANTWTLGVVNGGTVEDFRGGANVIVSGSGMYRPMKDAAVSGEVRLNGGVFNPRTTGTIAKIVGTGGVVTPEGAPGPVTVTNADFYAVDGTGVTVFEEAAGSKITFSSTPVYYGTSAPQKTTGTTGTGIGA